MGNGSCVSVSFWNNRFQGNRPHTRAIPPLFNISLFVTTHYTLSKVAGAVAGNKMFAEIISILPIYGSIDNQILYSLTPTAKWRLFFTSCVGYWLIL